MCLSDNKSSLLIYMFFHPPLELQLSDILGLYLTSLTLTTVKYQRQVNAPRLNPLFTYYTINRICCTPYPQTPQGQFPEFIIVFPPLVSTITLDFPAFTFNHLSRRLRLLHSTKLLHCWWHKYYVMRIQ